MNHIINIKILKNIFFVKYFMFYFVIIEQQIRRNIKDKNRMLIRLI